MSSIEPQQRRTTARQAAVLTDDTATTLAALGAAFDDLVLLDAGEVDQLAAMSADTVVVVDGVMTPLVRDAVIRHVATRPGSAWPRPASTRSSVACASWAAAYSAHSP